ncbi:hypothetical protein GUITHDRAFT_136096 [Guillardia theta CCMP2712]|uniref:Uncharacterized protein n=1 Tax=Guillardia theta (strain CCMP2712) TaxID=905079 RepID=L1JLL6_GUITC|nr:hypothetical protein GUITHDRAFT_136096 [Guillardia theta CCMP2712]EKX49431.1 hypothetical protein GUITHDRAFT_136096 [Guillardia theta CCMP2712]|eukprot:XP_005836411.1 hypothetical protein GUITHDRAFT_136096 [Guillardia theta CCMP2712]
MSGERRRMRVCSSLVLLALVLFLQGDNIGADPPVQSLRAGALLSEPRAMSPCSCASAMARRGVRPLQLRGGSANLTEDSELDWEKVLEEGWKKEGLSSEGEQNPSNEVLTEKSLNAGQEDEAEMMKGFAELEEEHELESSSDRKSNDNSSQWGDLQLDEDNEEGKEEVKEEEEEEEEEDLAEQIAKEKKVESEEQIENEDQVEDLIQERIRGFRDVDSEYEPVDEIVPKKGKNQTAQKESVYIELGGGKMQEVDPRKTWREGKRAGEESDALKSSVSTGEEEEEEDREFEDDGNLDHEGELMLKVIEDLKKRNFSQDEFVGPAKTTKPPKNRTEDGGDEEGEEEEEEEEEDLSFGKDDEVYYESVSDAPEVDEEALKKLKMMKRVKAKEENAVGGEGVPSSNVTDPGVEGIEMGDAYFAMRNDMPGLLLERESESEEEQGTTMFDQEISLLRMQNKMKQEREADEDPEVTKRQEEKMSLWRKGSIFHSYYDMDRALEYYERALSYWEEFSKDDEEVAAMTFAIGTVYKTMSQWEKAREYFRRSLTLKRRLWGDENQSTQLTSQLLEESNQEVHTWEISKNMWG